MSAVDKDGKNSYATYDGMGNLTSMTGPLGCVVGYAYNTAGQVTEKNGLTGASYTYNALGLIKTLTKNEGGTTTYTYDKAGRITGFVDSEGTTTYTYDANGNVITASDDVGTVRREYDALNRVTKYTDINGRVIQYEYDSCGNLKKMTYPNGENGTYTYDPNHNMLTSSMSNGAVSKASTFEYNSKNQITKINNPDGSVVSKTYDSAGRLTRLKDVDKNGQIIVNDTYSYDNLGRITTETSAKNAIRYLMEYDNLGRLTKRTEYDISTSVIKKAELFTYDAAGNITSDTSGGKTNTYTYGTDNDLSSMNNSYFDIDNNGNLLECPMYKGTKTSSVTYDSKNRLTHFGGDTYSYLYDVENNRVNMYAAGTNTMYTYDCSGGRHRLAWTKNQRLVETTYAYGADGLIWSSSDGTYSIYHYDYRGSVVAVTDIDGNVTATAKYDAYGYVISKTGTGDRTVGYNGRDGVLTDPDGLLYMRARYYSPILKRFLNCDIIDGSIADSTTLNLYAYVNGNPISYVDPFGLCADRAEGNENDSGLRIGFELDKFWDPFFAGDTTFQALANSDNVEALYNYLRNGILVAERPSNIGPGTWSKLVQAELDELEAVLGKTSIIGRSASAIPYVSVVASTGMDIYENIQNGTSGQRIASDAIVDVGFGGTGILFSALSSAVTGFFVGSAAPGVGNLVCGLGGLFGGLAYYALTEVTTVNGKSAIDWAKDGLGNLFDRLFG